MAQYDFFSKYRVPAETVDIPRQAEVERSKHVIIIRNGHVSQLFEFHGLNYCAMQVTVSLMESATSIRSSTASY